MIPRHEKRRLETRFVRVPSVDWPQLLTGEKTQLRVAEQKRPHLRPEELPSPIVAYTNDGPVGEAVRGAGLFVVYAMRVEPLAAIRPGDLRAEGFETLDEFRRYWNAHRYAFKPLMPVAVLEIGPWTPEHAQVMGAKLLDGLYGPWL